MRSPFSEKIISTTNHKMVKLVSGSIKEAKEVKVEERSLEGIKYRRILLELNKGSQDVNNKYATT